MRSKAYTGGDGYNRPGEPMPRDEIVPSEATIYSWIEEVFSHGIRRPGYAADRWAEDWCQERFRELGLENVRAEPVDLPYWEPKSATLSVTPNGGEAFDVPCFPLPHSASTSGVEAELVAFDPATPGQAEGAVSLYDVRLQRPPHMVLANLATWYYDPEGTFADAQHILPFGREIMGVMEPSMAAGAAAFIGVLSGYPGDSHEYYVPYDAVERALPGVWISGSAGQKLRDALEAGSVRAKLTVDAVREPITSYNIIGELPGADEEIVIIGSHHDGPWSSAVEDSSGIALVLAQAAYWTKVEPAQRPHRLVFLLNAGHMAGGAGTKAFIANHTAELERTVLEVHLEHAANEYSDATGELKPTGQPEARWWFTSRIAPLEDHVRAAIEAEGLGRSLIMSPTVFGERPTTDGGDFHLAGVPIVNYLTAPFYLFDSMDTMDKIHRPSLVPVTRAAIRIIESTAGVSAAQMRGAAVTGGQR
ncbi:MAG: M28 family peptidase [Dehalococcoidia bacterium]